MTQAQKIVMWKDCLSIIKEMKSIPAEFMLDGNVDEGGEDDATQCNYNSVERIEELRQYILVHLVLL